MEVDKSQAVFHALLPQNLYCFEQFARVEAEFACVASAFGPFAGSRRSQFNAYAYYGAHAEFFGGREYKFEFVQLFYHEEYSFSHFLRQECEFYEALVFVSVAYHEAVGVHVCGQHGVQFRF